MDGGTLQIPAGSLASPTQYVGLSGTGTLIQSGGVNALTGAGQLYLGYGANSSGTYLLSGGSLSASTEYIGYSGSGSFTQTGGTNSISNALSLGTSSGASGTYNLFGGLLVVPSIPPGAGLAALNITGGSLIGATGGATLAEPIVLTSSASNGTIDASSALTVTGQISGSGGLTKTGFATLVLASSNTYSGDTSIAQGTLLLANSNAAQNTTVSVSVNNGLQFSGSIGAFNVASIAGSGNLTLANTGGGAITLVTGGNNASTTYGGVISGPGVLVHNGSGTLTLTASNTYTGGTILGPDSIVITNALALGSGSVAFAGNATITVSGNMTIPNSFDMYSNTTGTVNTASYAVTLSGSISGPGNVTKTGAGPLILANSNTYSGETSISQGTLELENAAAAQYTTISINVDNGLQFSSGMGTCDVGGLSGSNALTLTDMGGNPVMLDVGGNNANTFFSGSIGGNGGLIKSGSGALKLSGNNSFTGGLVLDPGIFSIANDAALGGVPTLPSINITFAANSTLQSFGSFALAANRNILIGSGATATFDTDGNTLTIGGAISGPGDLTKVGSGTLVLYGANTYTGSTTIAAGTLLLDFSQAGVAPANIINNATNSSSLVLGGGTLAIHGNTGTSNSQASTGWRSIAGCSAIVLTAGSSNPLLLTLGASLLARAARSISRCPAARNPPPTASPPRARNLAGILGGYATVSGTNWAASSGTAGNITAYAAYTGGNLGALGSSSSLNLSPPARRAPVTSAVSFNTLNLTGTQGVTMSGGLADARQRRPDRQYLRSHQRRHLGRFGRRGTVRHYAGKSHDRQRHRRQRRGYGAHQDRVRHADPDRQ